MARIILQQVLRFSARRRHDNSGAGEEADVVGIAPELLGRCPDLADRPRQQLPRSLDDVDAAVINTNYAVPAGLIPGKDSIAIELPANNPYNNFIAVRERDRDAPWVSKLVHAFQNDTIRQLIKDKLPGQIPAF